MKKNLDTKLLLPIMLFFACSFYGCQEQKEIVIENEFLIVQIEKKGAQLHRIFHKQTESEILWRGDSAYWLNRSPVMFPVNVRFKDERFSYKGMEYEMPRMGLAVISDFAVQSKNKQEASFVLKSNQETKRFYPFDFRFKLSYQLDKNKLVNKFTVENKGIDTMYFALGGHPGFNCPFENGRDRSAYQYVFEQELEIDRIEISNSLVQENHIPFLKNESTLRLDDQRIPNGGMFVKNIENKKIGIGHVGESPFVTVDLGDFPNVNLWSPPGMPFACIEPMVSHHDVENAPIEIEKKSHLVKLPPGERKVYKYIIIAHGKNLK